MIKQDPETKDKNNYFYNQKNALTGRSTLENKLKELALIQEHRHNQKLLLVNEEKPVLKYYTNTGGIYPTSPLPDAYTAISSQYQNPFSNTHQVHRTSPSKYFESGRPTSSQREYYVPKLHRKNHFKIPPALIQNSVCKKSESLFGEKLFEPDYEFKSNLNHGHSLGYIGDSQVPQLPLSGKLNSYSDPSFKTLRNDNNKVVLKESGFPMPTQNLPTKDATEKLTKVAIIDKATMNANQSTSNKPLGFTPSAHYTTNVSRSLGYQQWSSTLSPPRQMSRPSSARKRSSITETSNSATNTINSYLRKLSQGHLARDKLAADDLAYQKDVNNNNVDNFTNGHDFLSENGQKLTVQYSPDQNGEGLISDRMQMSSRNGLRSDSKVTPVMDDLLRDIAITNSQPRSKVLISASSSSLPPSGSNKLVNGFSTLSKNRIALAVHRNSAMKQSGRTTTAPKVRHVSSIPYQNSRVLTDDFTVQNSSLTSVTSTVPKSANSKRRIRSAKQKSQNLSKQNSSKEVSPVPNQRQPSAQRNRISSARVRNISFSDEAKKLPNTARASNDRQTPNGARRRELSPIRKQDYRSYRSGTSSNNSNHDKVISHEEGVILRTPPITARTAEKVAVKKGLSINGDLNKGNYGGDHETKMLHSESMQLDAIISAQLNSECNIESSDSTPSYANGRLTSTDVDYEDEDLSDQDEMEFDDNVADEFIEDVCETVDGASVCRDSDSEKAMDEFYFDDNDVDCVDGSAIDCLDDDVASEDANSEYSLSTTESQSALETTATDSDIVKPALNFGNFSNCPPVLNFGTKFEKVEQLPADIRKLLKWKMSPITPIVVKHTIAKSGFKPSKKSHDWIGYFGKHMKSNGFRSLREYQKINHFPGSFQLGRKDRLWRNITRMQTRFGKKEFGFMPQSYILPWDKKLLKTAWEEGSAKQKFIIKPPASARGIGIRVIHKWNQIPNKRPVLVQKYLSRPYLINNRKFDLRLYVYVTSFDPLRIYMFDDGLVRFATCRYSNNMKHLSNRYMHLTNYSVNKKSHEFQQNDDASACQGHKWSIKALWRYFKEQGVDTDKIWAQMKDIVIKTIISVEQFTNSLIKSNCRRQSCCHELFGFDIMLDDRLRPWILEVNISPRWA